MLNKRNFHFISKNVVDEQMPNPDVWAGIPQS